MAFKPWNTVELVIGPRPSLLFREIPFNFEFEISSTEFERLTYSKFENNGRKSYSLL